MADTLRKDTVDKYGRSMPAISSLMDDSVIFDNYIATAPWTVPSHLTMFTGRYTLDHKIDVSEDANIYDLLERPKYAYKPIQRVLHEMGYFTMGISANIQISQYSRMEYGFDYFSYVDPMAVDGTDSLKSLRTQVTTEYGTTKMEIIESAIKKGSYLDLASKYRKYRKLKSIAELNGLPFNKNGRKIAELLANSSFEEPFYMYINVMEMHEPYTKKIESYFGHFVRDSTSAKELEELANSYNSELSEVDSVLGLVVRSLKSRNLYDNTTIIFTSDHGEMLGEHGCLDHGVFLWDELVKAPLIIKFPHNFKYKPRGYQDTSMFYNFITLQTEGGSNPEDFSREVGFSESNGMGKDMIKYKTDSRYENIRRKYDVVSKAIYKDGFKLWLNLSDGNVIEFTKDGHEVTDKVTLSNLTEELLSFSKGERKD